MDADYSSLGVNLSVVLSQRRFFKAEDIRVSACCTNPELCRQGDLFVATVSADRDGHDDVAKAAARGACGVLCERLLPIALPQCVVPNANAALATLCQRLAGNPGQQLPVIGVAGLRGLTACQLLVEGVLQRAGYRPAGSNCFGYSDGLESIPRATGTTTAAQHARWLASALANGCSHAVAELARGEVANRTFEATPLNSLILTELAAATHRQMLSPKSRFYFERVLERLDEDGLLVANVDCPVIRQLTTEVARPALTVSLRGEVADVRANLIERFPSEQTFMLVAGSDSAVVRTKVIGDAYVQACLLAAATGLGMGIDLPTVVRGIESVDSIPGHLERVECGQPFSVFTDGARTSRDLQQALQCLRETTERRLICVFGQGNSRKPELSARRGQVVEKLADLGVITTDDPLDRHPLRATHDILDGFREPSRAHVVPNRMRAIEWALGQCQPGDTLLLAGPHNQCLVKTEDGLLSDADVARYWLYELFAAPEEFNGILPRG